MSGREPDMMTLYKDITMLNKWKEHGDNRFLGRLKDLERTEANDLYEEYQQLQHRLQESIVLNRELAQIIRSSGIEVSQDVEWRMDNPELPF